MGVWLDRSIRRYVTGGLAALLFAVLPFAYQAIPWINNFFYPLNNLLLLLMAALYWKGRVGGRKGWLLAALALAFIAPFEIEYGLMAGGLLLALEVGLWLHGRQPRPWIGGALAAGLLNVAFLVVWVLVPKNPYTYGPPTPERLLQISVYMVQGLAYPVAPLGAPLMDSLGVSDFVAIALTSLPALAFLVAGLAARPARALLVASLLWFALLNLPALLTLTFDYVINSPRLLYPPGPAMAWLWAAFLALLAGGGRSGRAGRVAAAGAAVLLVAGQNIAFVRGRMAHYHIAERPVHQLAALARQGLPGSLLVVNMPSWLAPADRTFALGNNGIQFIPGYIGIEDVIFAQNDAVHPARAVQFANVRSPQPYYYGMFGRSVGWEELAAEIESAGAVYLAHYAPETIDLSYAGKRSGAPLAETATTFGDVAAMELIAGEREGGGLSLSLRWRLSQNTDNANLTVFTHLYGPDGQLVAQADGDLLLGLAPFWLWEGGTVLEERRYLTWQPPLPGGPYRVGVGVYDRASGERLPAVAGGERLADDVAIVLTLEQP
jgi:hypothetical protein